MPAQPEQASVPRLVHKIFIGKQAALPPLDRFTGEAHESWTTKNPGYKLEYWDGVRCRQFLLDEYDYEVVRAYDRFRPFAYRADLMKYCILFKRGGWYSDWKQVCLEQGLLDSLPRGLLCWDRGLDRSVNNGWLSPALIGVPPGDPLILKSLQICVRHSAIRFMGGHPVDPSGPGVFGKAFQASDLDRGAVRGVHRDKGFFVSGKRVVTHKHERLNQDQDWAEGNNYGNMWKRGRGHAYSARRDSSPVVVSLSTSPRRIAKLKPTINSILCQTRNPDAVLINLPPRFVRTGETYRVPAFLDELPAAVNRDCVDHGPATKLLPSIEWLRNRNWPENTKIITIDDDIVYPAEMIEKYATVDDSCAWSMSGLKIDRQNGTRPLPTGEIHGTDVDVLEGCAGLVVTLRMFNSTYKSFFDEMAGDFECSISDDVTLAWFLRMNRIRLRFATWTSCNHELLVHQPYGFEGDALRNISPVPYNEGASVQYRYSNVIDMLARNFPLGRPQSFSGQLDANDVQAG